MGKRREYNWAERIYYLEALKGLLITSRHFWVNVLSFLPVVGGIFRPKQETVTYQWPEQERPISPRWRGRHRLNKREDGSTKCVACMCCATACPSECIHIVAEPVDDPSIEKAPALFEIDLFRCVYCGMCVEACPCNAILMDTQDMRFCEYTPDKFVIGKEQLLDW